VRLGRLRYASIAKQRFCSSGFRGVAPPATKRRDLVGTLIVAIGACWRKLHLRLRRTGVGSSWRKAEAWRDRHIAKNNRHPIECLPMLTLISLTGPFAGLWRTCPRASS
jgi:hypothetical protein